MIIFCHFTAAKSEQETTIGTGSEAVSNGAESAGEM